MELQHVPLGAVGDLLALVLPLEHLVLAARPDVHRVEVTGRAGQEGVRRRAVGQRPEPDLAGGPRQPHLVVAVPVAVWRARRALPTLKTYRGRVVLADAAKVDPVDLGPHRQ